MRGTESVRGENTGREELVVRHEDTSCHSNVKSRKR